MTHFAREYGSALFSLAGKEDLTNQIMDEFNAVIDLFDANPVYLQLLAARSVDAGERKKLLDESMGGRIHPYLLNFMKILIERGSIARIRECLDMYVSLYNEMYNIGTAHVTSAVELDEDRRSAIRAKLENMTGKTMQITYSVDPELIGGLCVDVEGRRYDNTIRSRLGDIRRTLAGKE